MCLTHNGSLISNCFDTEGKGIVEDHCIQLGAHWVFLASNFCDLSPHVPFLSLFLLHSRSFWGPPASLSCFRDKSGEGASEYAPSQWETSTLAISDKRTALICTREVIMKHLPKTFNKKDLCVECWLWAGGLPSREHHDIPCFEGPWGEHWQQSARLLLLEMNLISEKMPTTSE